VKLSFANRVRLAAGAALIATALLAVLALRLSLDRGVGGFLAQGLVFLAVLGGGGLLTHLFLNRVLLPAAATLHALRDGVQGFRERDFSLQLAAVRFDELGELVELYNSVGEVLRDERTRLVQREMLLETVFEASPLAIVLTGAGDRVVFANRVGRELFAPGGRFEGLRFPEVLEQCPSALREALDRGQDSLFAVDQRGEEEVFHASRRAFDLNGQRHELTLVRRLTHELRRQEVDVWKRAIRTLSHELNNSLAPIASLARSVRLMVDQPEHAERLAGALDVIEERALHLKEFLEGYARFARLPSPRPEEVEWAPFLAELGALVSFAPPPELPSVPGWFDRGQLQQALINLLKNAHESESPPEEVRLEVEPAGEGSVRVKVLDRGSGMDEGELRRALLPFYTSKPGGSGLGLPLCREIVEAHGGHLRIEGRSGGGTAVVFWLPGRGAR
jgi:two-component system nitrogen regulation sensor histidine kinase NtrY